jgi:hypothetical protein
VYILVLGIYRSNNNSDWTEYKSLFDFLAYLFKFLYEGSYKPYPIFLGKQSFKNKKQFTLNRYARCEFFVEFLGLELYRYSLPLNAYELCLQRLRR